MTCTILHAHVTRELTLLACFAVAPSLCRTIRFIPPLTISEEEMAEALVRLEKALHKVFPNKK